MDTREIPRAIAQWDAAAFTVEPRFSDLAALIDRQELAWSVALDDSGRVRAVARIAQGSENLVHIPIAAVLAVPITAHCRRFVLAHSHPSGSLLVSDEDKRLTRQVMDAAITCGLDLLDHVILAPSGAYVSLVETGILAPFAPIISNAASIADGPHD